jgi:CRP/FNR family cyclic AMP-dependent transcriptional regulator
VTWQLLAPLTDVEREAFMAATRRRRFARNEVVFHEGDPADSLHLLESGHVAVRVTTPEGSRATVNVLRAGDVVGELALVGGGVRSATVVALDVVETRSVSLTAFQALCDRHPAVQRVLVEILAARVRALSAQLLDALYVGLDRRVYRCLMSLAAVYGPDGQRGGAHEAASIPLTQEQLAELVGGTRPSVNQVLQRLVAQGVIELGRGRVVVRDPATLRRKAAS